jgi:hypothetical protein
MAEDDRWMSLIDRLGVSHRFLRKAGKAWDQRVSVLGGRVQVLAGVSVGSGIPDLDRNVLLSAGISDVNRAYTDGIRAANEGIVVSHQYEAPSPARASV